MKNLLLGSMFQLSLTGTATVSFVWMGLVEVSIKSMLILFLAAISSVMLIRASSTSRYAVWVATMFGLIVLSVGLLGFPRWISIPMYQADGQFAKSQSNASMNLDRTFQVDGDGSHGVIHRVDGHELVGRQVLVGNGSATASSVIASFKLTKSENLQSEFAESPIVETSESEVSMAGVQKNSQVAIGNSAYVATPSMDLGYESHEPLVQPHIGAFHFTTWKLGVDWLVGIWAIGFLVCMARIVFAVVRLKSLERSLAGRRKVPAGLTQCVAEIAGRLQTTIPQILIGKPDAMPMVWNMGRSFLFLPSSYRRWSRAKLEAVLLHELNHLRRRDPFIALIASIVRAMYWFNPMVWHAIRQLNRECERSCDDHVLSMGVDPCDYATYLLEFSMSKSMDPKFGYAAIAMAANMDIESRISAVLDDRRSRNGMAKPMAKKAFLFVAIVSLTLAGTGLHAVSNSEAVEPPQSLQPQADNTDAPPIIEPSQEFTVANAIDAERLPESLESDWLDLTLPECIEMVLKQSQVARPLEANDVDLGEKAHGWLAQPSSLDRALTEVDSIHKLFGRSAPKSDEFKTIMALHNPDPSNHPLLRRTPNAPGRRTIVLGGVESGSLVAFKEQLVGQVRDVEVAYWDLAEAMEATEVLRQACERARRIHQLALDRFHTNGEHADIEAQSRHFLHQMETEYQQWIDNDSENNSDKPSLRNREKKLRELVGWNEAPEKKIRPVDNPSVAAIDFDWNSINSEAIRKNFGLQQAKLRVKQRELELVVVSTSMPSVEFSRLCRWLGANSMWLQPENGVGGLYQEGAVRLEYTPDALGSRRHHNDIRNKRIAYASEMQKRNAKANTVLTKLSSLVQTKDQLYQVIEQLSKASAAAQTLRDGIEGKASEIPSNERVEVLEQTYGNLLRAEQANVNAKLNYLKSLAAYRNALVDIHATKGSLLDYVDD
jgi:beta-lactamase regulating signal transducer with metallopeptidase domain